VDSLGSDTIDVMFHEHLSKGVLKGRQYILPRGDGTFPAIQLPLPGKELPLHLDGHRVCQSKSREWHHNKEASPSKRWHRVKIHLVDKDARLQEPSILA
jgi:hypothetical protein